MDTDSPEGDNRDLLKERQKESLAKLLQITSALNNLYGQIEKLKLTQAQHMELVAKYNDEIARLKGAIDDMRKKLYPEEAEQNKTNSNNVKYEIQPAKYYNTAVKLQFGLSFPEYNICCAKFSPDGSVLAVPSGNQLIIFRTSNLEMVSYVDIPARVDGAKYAPTRYIEFSPNMNFVAISGQSDDVIVYLLQELKIVANLNHYPSKVLSFQFSDDSAFLYTSGLDSQIVMWNTTDFTVYKQIKLNPIRPIVTLVMSNTNLFSRLYVGFGNSTLGIFHPSLDTQPEFSYNFVNRLISLAITKDGSYLAVASMDFEVTVWSVGNQIFKFTTLAGHNGPVTAVCFNPQGTLLFSGSKDETIRCWDFRNQKLIFTIKQPANTIFNIHHHPILNIILISAGDGVIYMFEYDPAALNA